MTSQLSATSVFWPLYAPCKKRTTLEMHPVYANAVPFVSITFA